MKEGYGGAMALGFMMTFIIIMSGYTAFTINYSKAFKVKSKLIDTIQKYDNDMKNPNIEKEMKDYIKEIGYSASSEFMKNCGGDNEYQAGPSGQGWCYIVFEENTNGQSKIKTYTKKRYVKVRTYVSIDIPVINRIFSGIRVFTVEGSTKSIYYK